MKILIPPATDNHNYHLPPKALREFHPLKATAIDADKFPIIALHWDGPLIVVGKLACQDFSPLVRRFETAPVVEIKGPDSIGAWRHVGDVADAVLARIAPETKDEAA